MSHKIVAIIGGAVAGSEAAGRLAERGIHSVVFEQNSLPYGKLEFGLPKWHARLRDRQEELVDKKLDNPYVQFVPNTKLGRDFQIAELLKDWPFSAILLALGAWRDRPLPVEGINDYIDKGLLYMTEVTNWFNQCHDPNYSGPNYIMPYKNVLVIGGGLASIDMIKIVALRQVVQRLYDFGIDADVLQLERKGIFQALNEFGLTFERLNIEPPKLIVRRSVEELPLTVLPENPTQEQLEKAAETRRKLIEKLKEKFPFELVERHHLKDMIVKDGQLRGLVFVEKGKQEKIVSIETELVISAIGSIPEPLPGIPMKGEIYDVEDPQTGKIRGLERVFALGNAVTGKANIRQSMLHSKQVTEFIVDEYLSVDSDDYARLFEERSKLADRRVDALLQKLEDQPQVTDRQLRQIKDEVKRLQEKVGYDGHYRQWIKRHLPARLEHLKGKE
ncbi:hypothetical protein Calab_0209 [Caldithrix abyssi DSM 13497]|uniref:NADPH-dependent glutamate synthase beta chain n=1 Tax=Caldithrix abyssi DSM 13497 TaxID=880073 RepID=H1XNR8_CALAY|nr:FAD-dependent oxidoreductase [Caldithrix abyssi]APF19753.1 NADPH-dependent glutamate synthase beta chain [Caldithrix abyssi DSM 13497]EHO39858.1 hypothetical protein Calab_0209 [Caldithrix abyssi DSM 13497]